MAKQNRVDNYQVVIEQNWNPEDDILDTNHICLHIYAQNVEDAVIKAWSILNVDKEKYRITSVDAMSCRPFRYYDNRTIRRDEF